MRLVKPLLLAALAFPELAAALPTTPIEVVESTVLAQRRKKRRKKAPPPATAPDKKEGAFEGLDLTGEGDKPADATGEGAAEDLLTDLEEGDEPEEVVGDADGGKPAVAARPPSARAGLHAFVGADSAIALRLPGATGVGLGYYAGARYALDDDLEFDLSIGQQQLGTFGAITLAWPAWRWLGQLGLEAAGRYRVTSFGALPLFAGASLKTLVFTAPAAQRGFYAGAFPVLPGLEVSTRFATPLRPLDVALKAHFWRLSGGFSPVIGLTTRMEVF